MGYFTGLCLRGYNNISTFPIDYGMFKLICSDVLLSVNSGEKTSIKEWPTSLEIKGRVRLDAFEKFLQELPMSRTRAVMVYQGLLLFIVTNSCPLRCWLLAFCLQIRQCSLLALMANDFNLFLVLVWMYKSSSDENFSKIYQKVNLVASMFSLSRVPFAKRVKILKSLLQQLPVMISA